MKTIELTRGKVTVVDDDDFPSLCRYKWAFTSNGYAARGVWKGKTILMHRLLLDAPKGVEVDHKNRDKLDNRRENIRLCSGAQNKQNRGIQKNNISGYRGVHWSSLNDKWRATIDVNGKRHHLGLFYEERDAALAYNESAKKFYGAFAFINKVS